MPLRYEYDQTENILHTYAIETLTAADIIEHFQRVCQDPSIKKDYIEVVHFGESTEINFSPDQANKFPKHFADMKDKTGIRATIFIGQNLLHFGIGRMLENLHDVHNTDDDIRVVQTMQEAACQIEEIRAT